jgi:hypothetical protein
VHAEVTRIALSVDHESDADINLTYIAFWRDADCAWPYLLDVHRHHADLHKNLQRAAESQPSIGGIVILLVSVSIAYRQEATAGRQQIRESAVSDNFMNAIQQRLGARLRRKGFSSTSDSMIQKLTTSSPPMARKHFRSVNPDIVTS